MNLRADAMKHGSKPVLFLRAAPLWGLFLLVLLALSWPPWRIDWDEIVGCLASNRSSLHPSYSFCQTEDRRENTETTVKARLQALGAFLKDGKVYDALGVELYFYEMRYPHRRDPRPHPHPENEIRELARKYHVIRMYRPS
jgi:hypothetical protein